MRKPPFKNISQVPAPCQIYVPLTVGESQNWPQVLAIPPESELSPTLPICPQLNGTICLDSCGYLGVRAKHSLGAAPIPEDHDDHHLEPWTSDIDNVQWFFNFDWETEFWPLPSVENSDTLGFFDFDDYHDTCVGALDTDPTFLAPQDDVFNVEALISHLSPVIEPSAFLDPVQGAANLSQNDLHSLTAHDLASCQQTDLPPPLCTSPSSDAPTSISPASSGYEKRSPQSSTSSPASNTAQLSCDFCRQPYNDVDSL
ncbi:hypothetical protein FDENT_2336 [Fusarium denticulatum]|uniref:Uncharacterized protein n=1 Tax=Fusarium denticulatum TaxID=48507 RepID=A0A8H5XG24_9HYPO|nr:hypothetical protein FDENT_2336 [Fusarium denticulatum]